VFEMFTQVDRSLEKAQGGLGIGLTIVKRLVEMHGGTVEARSDGHAQGSEFAVRLPVVRSVAAERTGQDHASSTACRRILVVDDNKDSAISLAMMLRIMGNETLTAHDGLEALDLAAVFKPHVVLLDIGMPKLNGYDTARRIRGQTWGKGMVLVTVTGWGQDEDKRQALEAGFDHHLVKPVDPAALEKLWAGLSTKTA
jgi:CheY-like chemotaxis protein